MKHLYPVIDIHGESSYSIVALIDEFINDNYKLNNRHIAIIHGLGNGILKDKTHELLKQNKLVVNFKLDNWNLGMTKITLKELDK